MSNLITPMLHAAGIPLVVDQTPGVVGKSPVPQAGMNDELAHSSLRFSVGRFTTDQDVDAAIEQVRHAVEKLRALSPLWDMYKDGVDLDSIEWAAH